MDGTSRTGRLAPTALLALTTMEIFRSLISSHGLRAPPEKSFVGKYKDGAGHDVATHETHQRDCTSTAQPEPGP
jgi:hypothetical protein